MFVRVSRVIAEFRVYGQKTFAILALFVVNRMKFRYSIETWHKNQQQIHYNGTNPLYLVNSIRILVVMLEINKRLNVSPEYCGVSSLAEKWRIFFVQANVLLRWQKKFTNFLRISLMLKQKCVRSDWSKRKLLNVVLRILFLCVSIFNAMQRSRKIH